ncbi:hypothetical protein P872_09165 [Rhodonellum psychrophilum GCM71 = DSM 17998]|uniref:Uncharacterized protein n=2 Tax=Rhodonellum TaxID=336827 RepID=U5BVD6_9BACT|nr:hypothetical protein P872_09165 [Rhodonellum psychrophilum GCM71 = DSM 17998]
MGLKMQENAAIWRKRNLTKLRKLKTMKKPDYRAISGSYGGLCLMGGLTRSIVANASQHFIYSIIN